MHAGTHQKLRGKLSQFAANNKIIQTLIHGATLCQGGATIERLCLF